MLVGSSPNEAKYLTHRPYDLLTWSCRLLKKSEERKDCPMATAMSCAKGGCFRGSAPVRGMRRERSLSRERRDEAIELEDTNLRPPVKSPRRDRQELVQSQLRVKVTHYGPEVSSADPCGLWPHSSAETRVSVWCIWREYIMTRGSAPWSPSPYRCCP